MARALTRTPFHSSRLVRVLADLARLQTLPSGHAFAERLGLWVDYTHAIALCAVHNAGPGGGAPATPTTPTTPATAATLAAPVANAASHSAPQRVHSALEQELLNLRASLENGIHQSRLPEPDLGEPEPSFESLRRYYLAQQRDMEQKVGPLRARVRAQLEQSTPAHQQLAALDAALESILSERESRLLYSVPSLLKQRFAQLRAAQPAPLAATATAAATPHPAPARTGAPSPAWLLRFGHELQTVLRAELDLRLQPTLGLLQALHNPTPDTV